MVVPSLFLFVPTDPEESQAQHDVRDEFAEDFPEGCPQNARRFTLFVDHHYSKGHFPEGLTPESREDDVVHENMMGAISSAIGSVINKSMGGSVGSGTEEISIVMIITLISTITTMSINTAVARVQKPMYSGSSARNRVMGRRAGAPYSGQNWASGCCSSCLAELPPFSGRVGCPQWVQKSTSRFSYGFPIFWVQLPLFSPLPLFPVSVLDISPVEAASLHTFFPIPHFFVVDFGG